MTTNYYARIDYTYSGGTKIFSVPFDYIEEEHLNVFINNNICTLWTNINTSQIQIDDSVDLTAGDTVTIIRNTPLDERMVVFSDTSILNKDNQNLAHEQVFDVVQEVHDSLNSHKQDVEDLKPYIKNAVENIESIKTVSENQTSINTVADDIANINIVASNTNNISTVASNIEPINNVSRSVLDVNEVASYINDIHTVSNNIDAVYDFAVQKDMVNQSKGLMTGSVSSDADVLETVKSYAHSTFDLSKFTAVGSPTITDDGVASGFSDNGVNVNIPELRGAPANFEINCNCYLSYTNPSAIKYSYLMTTLSYFGLICYVAINTNGTQKVDLKFLDANNQWVVQASTPNWGQYFQNNSNNNVKIQYNNGSYKLYVNNNLILSGENGLGLNFGSNPTIKLGNNTGDTSTSYWQGSIDLKQFSITVDGVEVFSGNKTGVDTIKPDNYTVVGTPTISDDGIASGFSESNKILSNFPFETFNTLDVYFKNPTSTGQVICFNNNCLYFWKDGNTQINFKARDINGINLANEYFNINQNIEFIRFNITKTSISMYADGSLIATRNIDITNLRSLNQFFIGSNMNGTDTITGQIDLNAIKIYVDGDLVYQPCLKIPYTLSKTGSKIVNSIYRSRVQDMHEQYGFAPYYTLSDTDFTLPMGEVYGMLEKSKNNGVIGQTIFSLDPLYNDNLHLLDGSILYGNGVYKEFIENYIKPLYSKQPSRFTTESAWQTSVTTYGVCGYYVYDSTNNTVRLPKVTGFVEGTLTASALGQLTQAGLPNITGKIDTSGDTDNNHQSFGETVSPEITGAFSGIYGTRDSCGDANAINALRGFTFDASRSSSIYGNSSTVQPQSIKGYMYIIVANGETGYVPTNTSGIITDLNNKTDKSAVDGQWVYKNAQLANEVTWTTNTAEATYSLSSYLPDDNYNYEVLFTGTAVTGTTSNNFVTVGITTDIITTHIPLCEARTRTTSTIEAQGNGILPVGQGRYVKQYSSSSSNANGTYSLYAKGYRRIGTNT